MFHVEHLTRPPLTRRRHRPRVSVPHTLEVSQSNKFC